MMNLAMSIHGDGDDDNHDASSMGTIILMPILMTTITMLTSGDDDNVDGDDDNDDYVDGDDDNDDYVEVYRQTHSLQSGERTLVCREGRVGGPLGKPGSGIFWCFSFE